ncbi:MAG: 3-deoxy-D-manno-octulosonic acid transferase [Lentisphaerae bacterium]|nr:3-deoxy-D-manno-octulosonic acid transferase [Lentisphaerota bacterium]
MKWILYNVLFTLGYLLLLPRFIRRMCRRGGYRRGFLQRFGVYDAALRRKLEGPSRLWVHAVSVGEAYVALGFVEAWRRREPGARFIFSVTTSTGRRVAEQGLKADDALIYFPSDFPWIVERVLDRLRPRALILTESELWPNLIRGLARRNIPVALINGRISPKSFRGYRRIRCFLAPVLRAVRPLLVQSEGDRRRVLDLGADPAAVHVVGSAKYDIARTDAAGRARARAFLAGAGIADGDPLIVGGSTWPGEERILLESFGRLRGAVPGLKLVLVPRHAERRAAVEAEIRRAGLRYVMRSDPASRGPADVVLVDTTGELADFYACATVIFVGKSLTQHGGQNAIEPAALGKPVVVGPNMENFPVVIEELVAAGALLQVQDAAELEAALRMLLADPGRRETLGARAGAAVRERRGATERSVARLAETLAGGAGPGAATHTGP